MSKSILEYFPEGKTPRPEQAQLLLDLEAAWDSHDVFNIVAPTATGKTELGVTIGRWQAGKSHFLVPQNVLVDQTIKRYPKELSALYKVAHYSCSIPEHRFDDKGKPRPAWWKCSCKHRAAAEKAQHGTQGLMNYWVYLYNQMHRPVAIFDECHKVIDLLTGINECVLLQKDYGFPDRFAPDEPYDTVGDFIDWVKSHQDRSATWDERLQESVRKLTGLGPETLLLRSPEDIRPVPLTATDLGRLLWPHSVKKIVLMSATTGEMDVRELALDTRRVCYLAAPSPIPATQRPFVYSPRFNLAHDSVKYGLPLLVQEIVKCLGTHPEKGMIHLPYGLALQVRGLLDHPRLIYHTKKDKAAKLAQFRNEPPEGGAVLVASGLYEGVDLPFDAARWQLIGKVPYLSLADPVIKAHAAADPDWYAWATIKVLLQAYGRIVRAPDDYGETFLYDTAFRGLMEADKRRAKPFFPQFFMAAYKEVSK